MSVLHLEVNDSGGWRRVMSFADSFEQRVAVKHFAEGLLERSDSPRIRARIIAPGTTAPLMTWTASDGWKEWRS